MARRNGSPCRPHDENAQFLQAIAQVELIVEGQAPQAAGLGAHPLVEATSVGHALHAAGQIHVLDQVDIIAHGKAAQAAG